MALLALILSCLAVIIAAASAFYSRQQAIASSETTSIERSRRYDERSPDFVAECEDVNGDELFFRLRVTLNANELVDRIRVELSPRSPLAFATGLAGVPVGSDGHAAESYEGPLRPGEDAAWRVDLDTENESADTTVLVRAFRGDDQWEKRVTVELPYDLDSTIL